MTSFTVGISSSGIADRVELCGELDLASIAEFDAVVGDRATAGRHVTLDLSQLSFCGCAGISALLRVQRDATHAGGCVRFAGIPRQVWRTMRVCGVDELTVLGGIPADSEQRTEFAIRDGARV